MQHEKVTTDDKLAQFVKFFFIYLFIYFFTVLSFLPTKSSFSEMPANTATSTLCTALSRSLDPFCPLTYKPVRPVSCSPWLSDIPWSARTMRSSVLGWTKSILHTDLSKYWTAWLLSFSAAKSSSLDIKYLLWSTLRYQVIWLLLSSSLLKPQLYLGSWPSTAPILLCTDLYPSFYYCPHALECAIFTSFHFKVNDLLDASQYRYKLSSLQTLQKALQ